MQLVRQVSQGLLRIALLACITIPWLAFAESKPNVFQGGNRWLITAFNDTSSNHTQWATQGICFLPPVMVGTHLQGIWFSDTFPNWRGRYSQEGDRLLMHGDYARDVGHDGIVMELYSAKAAAGQWTEWREYGDNGKTIGFLNASLSRVGKCSEKTLDVRLDQYQLFKLAERLSYQVKARYKLNGLLAEAPAEPGQVPIPRKAE